MFSEKQEPILISRSRCEMVKFGLSGVTIVRKEFIIRFSVDGFQFTVEYKLTVYGFIKQMVMFKEQQILYSTVN